jgi:molybdenum cofactor synthesis domain-containing protein
LPVRALVITVSDRAAAGAYSDRSGPLLVSLLTDAGCAADEPVVVTDGGPVEAALRAGIAAGFDVIVTTGGTGLAPRDQTPEMTALVIDRLVPGIPEAIRAFSRETVPTSALSRGIAGVAGRTLIVNLPGSTGGVRDGVAVLAPILAHAVEQMAGGDHAAGGAW